MKKYWRSLDEVVTGPVEHEKEVTESADKENVLGMLEGIPFKIGASRRDFIKLMSYSVASSALLAACKKPVQHAIPYLIQPREITPGVASHYASTFYDGSEYSPVVVKVRDGRPIKLEGNRQYKYTKGGTSPRLQASVLSLYDNARIQNPLKKNNLISWDDADNEIIAALNKISNQNKQIVILTSTLFSPSTLKLVDDFKNRFPSARVVNYDGISFSGMVDAFYQSSGIRAIPYPMFDKAETIVSFGADFLGTWLMPVEFALAYVQKRKVEKGQAFMSRHIQFESGLSLTGSNADERIQISPFDETSILTRLHNLIASKTGRAPAPETSAEPDKNLEKIAAELLKNRGKSIVISGSNDIYNQKLIIAINMMLDNYGNTFDLQRPLLIRQGSDSEMSALINDMAESKVGAVFFNHVNPCYDYYETDRFINALQTVELKVSFSGFPNETVPYCDYVLPDFHFLESWNDFEPRTGIFSISQPAIHHIFNSRQMQDSLLKWSGSSVTWQEYLKNNWQNEIYPGQSLYPDFDTFWVNSLRNGIYEAPSGNVISLNPPSLIPPDSPSTTPEKRFIIQLTVPVAISSPYHSNNPWLQELPDPVTRVTWDNYASISPRLAGEKGIETGDMIMLGSVEIPALVQPGQAYNVISIHLNYGRKVSGKVAEDVGVNVYPFQIMNGENVQYFNYIEEPRKTGKKIQFALTQTHHTLEGREIVRETTLKEYREKPNSGNEIHEEFEAKHQTLYPHREYDSFHWGLGVDLNSCIGCGACTIACQAENNVAVVGKEQVTKRRIMHWIRIDRYYTGIPEAPSVLFQPVMCQHCDNAPCENVCPVAATTHSNEGLNQMAYNRCVGTRYCINNCPYKVRRFNWFKFTDNPKFDYNQNSSLGKLVLNPDVVVRERGVVEKCTFCVQRIQEKKLEAKLENRTLKDGEVVTACVQACPAEALTFGDLNDKHSNIFKLYSNERNYHLLEELHTLPKVGYLTKVRNTEA